MRCVPERCPFAAKLQPLIFNSILERAPVTPVRLNPDVPAELERIINKALEKDRDVRCQSAAEVRADLKRLRRDTTSGKIEAVPAPRHAHRPRWLWPAAIACVVAAIAAAFAWLNSSPPPPRVLNTTQLTRDGIPKGNLVTDGSRLYMDEATDASRIVQASAAGGETSPLPTPFANAHAIDISPDHTQLLVASSVGTANGISDLGLCPFPPELLAVSPILSLMVPPGLLTAATSYFSTAPTYSRPTPMVPIRKS